MISQPIIRKIKDNEIALAEFEKYLLSNEDNKVQEVIMNFPTVYIHNWSKTEKYEVYVGESNNIFNRTREHYHNRVNDEKWQHRLLNKNASLYIIGHEHFNKSLTLDIENRLMHCLMSVDSVKQVHNGRGNPQRNYYPQNEFDEIFKKIWEELHQKNKKLFPSEQEIEDSAIYKASPLHKLTDEQEEVKDKIIDRIEMAMAGKRKQIVFIDGEAGTGKTVLNSSIFYELFCRTKNKNAKFNSYMVVNHEEQVKVYEDVYKKLGVKADGGKVVSKATNFINKHSDDSVDVVFIDEAHLLFTQGNQGYSGKNQLDDIVKKAKVTVIVFDENQILRMDQYWESQMINKYRIKAIKQNNHFVLTKQLRMRADRETLEWIDNFTKNQTIGKIPHGGYDIRVFDSPFDLDIEINKKAHADETKLSRLIASYDWEYKKDKRQEDRLKKYWEVIIDEWHKPWNDELKKDLNPREKRKIKDKAWAEQEQTICEVGSTYKIQGFDLNYAGVILGKSVTYRNGRIEYIPSESCNDNVNKRRTMSDGTMQNFGEELLKHEIRVLMTRGVNGLYIYACDPDLRAALLEAAK